MVRSSKGVLRPGNTFEETITAVMPATVASCERAVYDEFVG
jgi:hypothetical protein